jgi:hypothetical protein
VAEYYSQSRSTVTPFVFDRFVEFKNAMEADRVSPLPLNCPKCPRRLKYITTTRDGIHVYVCAVHGAWQLGPGGIYRPPLPVQVAR